MCPLTIKINAYLCARGITVYGTAQLYNQNRNETVCHPNNPPVTFNTYHVQNVHASEMKNQCQKHMLFCLFWLISNVVYDTCK